MTLLRVMLDNGNVGVYDVQPQWTGKRDLIIKNCPQIAIKVGERWWKAGMRVMILEQDTIRSLENVPLID